MAKSKRLRNSAFFREIGERFGEAVSKRGKEALERGGDTIAQTAKSLCPVDTGRLRDSIHVETSAKGARVSVIADAENPQNGVKYARIVEFSPKINESYMIPAYDAHKHEIRQSVIDAIRDAIKEVQQ